MSAKPALPGLAPRGHMAPATAKTRDVTPGSLAWIIRHELRLAFRDWARPGRHLRLALILIAITVVLHLGGSLFAHMVPSLHDIAPKDRAQLFVYLTLGIASIFTMMIAQAMEAVTRAFYVRGDLELMLSSPFAIRRLFAVRMVAITLTSLSLVGLLLLPFVNMLAWSRDWHWLGIYGVIVSAAALAQALALAVTVGLFRLIGPKRTRLVAQIVGAVLGATAVIGGQVPAILGSGSLSQIAYFSKSETLAALPGADSPLWWPARAAISDPGPLLLMMIGSFGALALAIAAFSHRFAGLVVSAGSIAEGQARKSGRFSFASAPSPLSALRRKELRLILRDPWLMSQSLMQILYMIPAVLLLWRNFGSEAGTLAVLAPALVMAAGQLAGGLAWLAISAEDAPDLIATAPIPAGLAIRGKIEAVGVSVAVIVAPFLLGFALASPEIAAIAAVFSGLAVASATLIQFCFRSRARRSQFRMRQRSSRLATFAETFCALAWAGSAGLLAAGNTLAILPATIALTILAVSWIFGVRSTR